MASTHSFPSKLDIVKLKTYDFLENERLGGELVPERDFGNNTAHENSQATRHHEIAPQKKDQLKEELIDDTKFSRSSIKKKTEIFIVTDSSTDFSGSAPKRYTTTCYIEPKNVPYWYSESIFLKIGSTKRTYQEKILFKEKPVPVRWTETMSTEITKFPKNIVSEISIPVEGVFIELRAAA